MLENSFWFAVVFAALGELLLHWAPWPRTLPRVVAYVLGVLVILIGCAIWLIPSGHSQVLIGMAGVTVAAGLATVLGYAIDRLGNLLVRTRLHDRNRP